MAVYGVSPYAMPPEIAMGCMLNIRMANAMKALPTLMSIGSALGNKAAAGEMRAALRPQATSGREQARDIIEQLKLQGGR